MSEPIFLGNIDNENGFEIFFDDLKPEVARELLNFLDIECPEEGNYDVIPVAIIPPIEKNQEML